MAQIQRLQIWQIQSESSPRNVIQFVTAHIHMFQPSRYVIIMVTIAL